MKRITPLILAVLVLAGCAARDPAHRMDGTWVVDIARTTAYHAEHGIPDHVWKEAVTPEHLRLLRDDFEGLKFTTYGWHYEDGWTQELKVWTADASTVVFLGPPVMGKYSSPEPTLDELINRNPDKARLGSIDGLAGYRFLGEHLVEMLHLGLGTNGTVVTNGTGVFLKRIEK